VLTLRPVTSDNLDECTDLQVSSEQLAAGFADTVAYSLAEAYVFTKDADPVTTFPFAIYDEKEIVGFVLMEIVSREGWIINFLIDQRFQGRGYGKTAFAECVKYLVEAHLVTTVLMPVKPGNQLVLDAALRYGFRDSGELDEDGEHMVLRLDMPVLSQSVPGEIEYRYTKTIPDAQLRSLYNSQHWTAYTDQIDDLATLLTNCNIVCSAWDGDKLIGLVRTFGDDISICYIQDILVNPAYARRGIGKRLLYYVLTQQANVRNIALSTDAKNNDYVLRWYGKQGFQNYSDIGIVGYSRLAELTK